MAFITADRVKDTSTTTGTGNIVVSGGAPIGYRTFSTVLSVGDTFYYCVTGQASSEWEVGLGTYLSVNTFARTTVLASSASGSAVSFSSGTKNVFITLPANKTLQFDAAASPTAGAILYGTGSMLAYTAVGTSGQFLQSTGSGAPTWAPIGSVGTSISNGTSNVNIASSNGAVTVATNGTTAMTVDTSQNTTFAATVAMSSSFKRNRLINGNMAVAQRGTTYSLTSTLAYGSIDRFFAAQNGTANGRFAQLAYNANGFAYIALLGRNGSATTTGVIYAGQTIETLNVAGLAGNSITLSFYAYAGANFSAASSQINVVINSGTAADQGSASGVAGTWTGLSVILNATQAITTSLTRYTFTATVPSNCQELQYYIAYTPVGTAGADDNIYFTGVQLEVGTKATPYEMQIYSDQLAQCQRYYVIWKGVADAAGYSFISNAVVQGSGLFFSVISLPVTMRQIPAISYVGTITGSPNAGTLSGITNVYNQKGSTVGVYGTISVTGTINNAFVLYTYNDPANYLYASAEL
jgi:hypothetical protein